MFLVAFVLLICWSILGSFDLRYYHENKYSLHLHPESIREHSFHTVRAICYPIIIFTLFYKNFSGFIFYVGVLAVIIDTIFFVLDAFEEKRSRDKWGGLSHGESITHLFSNTTHYCAITTILLSKIYLDVGNEYPIYLSITAIIFTTGGIITAIKHIWSLYKFYLK